MYLIESGVAEMNNTQLAVLNFKRFSVYNFKIGKQLADVSTTMFCASHPQGESETRCQNMYIFIVMHLFMTVKRCMF